MQTKTLVRVIFGLLVIILVMSAGFFYVLNKNKIEKSEPEESNEKLSTENTVGDGDTNSIKKYVDTNPATQKTNEPSKTSGLGSGINLQADQQMYYRKDYNFEVRFPKTFAYAANYGEEFPECEVEKVGSDGITHFSSIKTNVQIGTQLPLIFNEGKSDNTGGFTGSVEYRLSSKCPLVSVVDIKALPKDRNFSLAEYLEKYVNDTNDAHSQSATGGGGELVYEQINGELVPVIRESDYSAVRNTGDSYYFVGQDYLYILSFSYPAGNFDDKEHSKGDLAKYDLAKKIISGFNYY